MVVETSKSLIMESKVSKIKKKLHRILVLNAKHLS